MTATPGARGQAPLAVAFGGLVALAAAMGIGRFVYTPILPFMLEALDLSNAGAGLIASANYLGYLAGALAAAGAWLRGDRRRWFLGALLVSALSTGAMALTTSLAAFLLLRLAGGVASALVMVFGAALVLDRLAAAGRPGLSAVHFAGVGAGIALSAVLVSGLAALGFGWRAYWLAGGLVSLAALAAALRLVPGAAEEPTPPTPAAASASGPGRRLVALVVAYGLVGFGYVITATFISAIVRATPSVSAIEPVVWLVTGLAAAPSVALWNAVARRAGTAQAFAAACLVQGIAVAMSVLAANAAAVLVAAALLGSTVMGLTALGLVHARTLARGDPRRMLALMTASFGLGQMVGPSFAGYAWRFGESFLLPSLVAAAGLGVAAALARWRPRPRPAG